MRRNDREITDRQEILKIMRKCDVCRLALNDDGFPYVILLNFGLIDNEETVELISHSALEGHKVDLMKADNRAAFEMDCSHQLQYFEERGYCTFSYESVMGYNEPSLKFRKAMGFEELASGGEDRYQLLRDENRGGRAFQHI